MSNYSLGEAKGRISIDYDGSWVDRAKESVASFKRGAEDAARSAGETFKALGGWKGVGDDIVDVGKKLTLGLTAPAVAAGAALGAMTLGPGLNRLVAIDNAQAKLKGLGHDAGSVQTIMDNALASVKGTAFGLGDAATVAANAVAAGVKPGQDLERTLKLTADAATIAGVGMGEMGAVFNKVAASNKVQMDVINQLHDAGVPALALLAQQLGVTAEEAAKMASDGKIDFATFQAAMEQGMGGAALESGKTFEGAMANMKAAMGRFGAELLQNVLPMVQEAFGKIMEAFDKMKPLATQIASAVTPVIKALLDGIISLADWFGKLSPEMQGAIMGGVAVAAAIGPALIGIGKAFKAVETAIAVVKAAQLAYAGAAAGVTLATNLQTAATTGQKVAMLAGAAASRVAAGAQAVFNAVMNANPIMLIVTAIAALVAGLIWFFTQTKVGQEMWANFMKFLQEAWTNIASFFTTIWEGIVQVATTVWNAIMTAIGAVVDWFQAYVWPVIQFVIDMIVAYFQMYWMVVSTVWNAIMAVIQAVVDWFMSSVWPTIQAFIDFLVALFNFLWQAAVFAWQSMIDFIVAIVTTVVNWLVEQWNMFLLGWSIIWQAVSDFFTTIWNAIVAFITPIVNAIAQVIQTVFNAVWGFIQTVFNNVRNFIMTVWNAISNAVSTAVNAVWSVISGTWSAIVGFVTDVFNNVKNAIMNPVRDAVNFIGTIKDQIMGFFSGAGDWLFNIGKDIIDGFLKGLQSMWNEVGNFFRDLTNMIPETKGPPARDRILLTENGRLIMQSLYNGLNAEMGDVLGLMSGLNATIPATLSQSVAQDVLVNAQTKSGKDQPSIVLNLEYHAAPGDGTQTKQDVFRMLGHATELVRDGLT